MKILLTFHRLSLLLWLPHLTDASGQELDRLMLKDYAPVSLYRIPTSRILRAAYPVIDVHSHPSFAKSRDEIKDWVAQMDQAGIERTILLTGVTGEAFDRIVEAYAEFADRFELWCGFDYTGSDQPDYGPAAVAELERCYRRGARGVGEESDKGQGLTRPIPGRPRAKADYLHMNDPRMDPLLEKCAELGMPVNLHVADPIWMYQPMDGRNEGMINAYLWRLDQKKDLVDLNGMIDILAATLQRHPRTTFIACHLANLDYDLARLGALLDRHPNLYADISARFAETATIPRVAAAFFERYQDRLLYGSDMEFTPEMYQMTFRILESSDDHFYGVEQFSYLWNLYGLGLSPGTLRKIYGENARQLLHKGRSPGR